VCGGGQDDAAIILDQALLPLLKLIERGGDKEKAAAVCFLGTVVEMRPAVAVRATSSGRPLPGGLSHLWLGRSMVCHASGLRAVHSGNAGVGGCLLVGILYCGLQQAARTSASDRCSLQ